MASSRRDFLKRTGFALGATAFVSRLGMMSALAQAATGPTVGVGTADGGDYKALVCLYMHGGNDGFNMVVPLEQSQYDYYAAARPTVAIPQAQLLPINPMNVGQPFGLHPSLSELQTLWMGQKLGIVCNVGSLLAPITPSEYRSNPSSRPKSLFDHYAQEHVWQDLGNARGWGQTVAGFVQALNNTPRIPMLVNVTGGTSVYLAGTDPFITLTPGANLSLQGFNSTAASTARYNALRQLQMLDTDAALVRVVSDSNSKAIDDAQLTSSVLGSATIQTVFPTSGLGKQLLQIAKLISVRASLGQNRRQVFFADIGGFDTHAGQLTSHASLLRDLSQSLDAFYRATVELGVASQVATFTLSEFGRTIQNSGDGTDHAWGSHALVMGDGVRGGNFYGQFPSIVIGGPNDVDTGAGARGRMLPTTSVDQYAATLASWFGLDDSAVQAAIPNISRFSPTNLGFMA